MEQTVSLSETTVTEAKAFLQENMKKGVICPCCSQFSKTYKRPVTSSMAYGLIVMYKHCKHKEEFLFAPVHIQDMFKNTPNLPSSIHGDFPKLKYWGLIKQGAKEGYYSLTENGLMFARGLFQVQSHALLYNNNLIELSGNFVDIHWCLKKKFNYSDLMNNSL